MGCKKPLVGKKVHRIPSKHSKCLTGILMIQKRVLFLYRNFQFQYPLCYFIKFIFDLIVFKLFLLPFPAFFFFFSSLQQKNISFIIYFFIKYTKQISLNYVCIPYLSRGNSTKWTTTTTLIIMLCLIIIFCQSQKRRRHRSDVGKRKRQK